MGEQQKKRRRSSKMSISTRFLPNQTRIKKANGYNLLIHFDCFFLNSLLFYYLPFLVLCSSVQSIFQLNFKFRKKSILRLKIWSKKLILMENNKISVSYNWNKRAICSVIEDNIIPRLPSSLLWDPVLFTIRAWQWKLHPKFIHTTNLSHALVPPIPNSMNSPLFVKKDIFSHETFKPFSNPHIRRSSVFRLMGFMLIGDDFSAQFCICNPVIGEIVELPKSTALTYKATVLFGFGFNPLRKVFEVLCSRRKLENTFFIETYTLGDSNWVYEGECSYEMKGSSGSGLCVYFKGNFHWFKLDGESGKQSIQFICPKQGFVKTYDLPLGFKEKDLSKCAIVVLNGIFTVSCCSSNGLSLFRMHSYGSNNWTAWLTIPHCNCPILSSFSYPLVQLDEVILIHRRGKGFFFYNFVQNSFREVIVGDLPTRYIQALVSTPHPLKLKDAF